MSNAHEKTVFRQLLGLFVSITLACGVCSVAAFANADDLAAATVSSSQYAVDRLLSTQVSSNVKSAKKTTKQSAAFAIKKYKKTKNYRYATGKWAYGKPIVKGKSKAVKRINNSLDKRYKKFRGRADGILEYAEEAGAAYKGATFLNTYATKATYNAKGYVSFRYSYKWFAGGVFNSGFVGDAYFLKTGKKLNVSQVVSGNAAQVKRKIANAAASQINLDIYASYTSAGSAYKQITSKKISEFEFYLKNGKVIVAIEPYTWPGQRSALAVTLKGNYA